MRLAFLDTSIINQCQKNLLTGCELRALLKKKNLIPILGPHTTFELSKDYLNGEDRVKKFFKILLELDPEYTCKRSFMYEMEYRKIKKIIAAEDFLAPPEFKEKIRRRVLNYANGSFSSENFIRARQDSYDTMRKGWDKTKMVTIPGIRGATFSDYVKYCFQNPSAMVQGLVKRFSAITEEAVSVDESDAALILNNLNTMPALRCFIYTQLYIEFKFAASGDVPAEDRFTDGLQLIEASYCAVYVTHDLRHAKYINEINPNIEVVLWDDLAPKKNPIKEKICQIANLLLRIFQMA